MVGVSRTYKVFLQVFDVCVVGNSHLRDGSAVVRCCQVLKRTAVYFAFFLSDFVSHAIKLLVLLLFVVHFRFV